jgi:glycogen phosphorylase
MKSNEGITALPNRISRLADLAFDLSWSWNPPAREVFRQIDYPLWRSTAHNPVRILRTVPRERLEQAAQEPSFLAAYDTAIQGLDQARLATGTWWSKRFPDMTQSLVAYFSAEFALHQSLPIYAGGLGVLAGDHCKEASDLGVPLIGIGFMYPQGYFHQNLTQDGWQQEVYEQLNWHDAPLRRELSAKGEPGLVRVPIGGRVVVVSVWRMEVGGVKLYLLDTDLEENAPPERELSARLYGGDREVRLRQEVVLGIGGVRALRALGLEPKAWHLNEGHAAFVVLERMRELLEGGESFAAALEQVRETTVFTTHTPVPAGHDAFPLQVVESHLSDWWGDLHAHTRGFLDLGTYDNGSGSLFNMTALALRAAGATNAVSRLHRQVTSEMWAPIWPGVAEKDRPVKSVTNGVHLGTWIAPAMADLFDRHLGPDWKEKSR